MQPLQSNLRPSHFVREYLKFQPMVMKPRIPLWELPDVIQKAVSCCCQIWCCQNWGHFMFYLFVCISQQPFCEEFTCWEEEERALLGIRKIISQDHCYTGSKPPFISVSSYVTWRSNIHPWIQGKDLHCLTSWIQLYICYAISGNVRDHKPPTGSSSHTR